MKTNNRLVATALIALIVISSIGVLTQSTKAIVDLRCEATLTANNPGAGKDASYKFVIINIGSAKLGSANITIPAGYTNLRNLNVTSMPAGQTWEISRLDQYILIHGSAVGLNIGEKITFTFDAVNPSKEGYYTWIIGANQNTGEGGFNYPEFILEVKFLVTPNLFITPSSNVIEAGTTISASAHIEDSTSDASGTVTYKIFKGTYPNGILIDSQTVTVANTIVPPYSGSTLTIAGTYYITAEYSGDSRNNPASGQDKTTGSLYIIFTVTHATLDHFIFSTIGSPQTIGLPFPIIITAQDRYANTITNYAGTPSLTYSEGTITPSISNIFVSGVGTTEVTLIQPSAEATITAADEAITGTSNIFTVGQYKITATAAANGIITPSGIIGVQYSASQSFTITPNAGYRIEEVKVDDISVGAINQYEFTCIGSDHTIVVSFVINTYTITATAGAHGAISPTGAISVNYGSSQTFSITPAVGYHTVDVLVDGTSIGIVTSYDFTNTAASHTITASFSANPYTITVTQAEHGTINPGTITVANGGSATFTITPDVGYHIVDVIVDGVSKGIKYSWTFTNVVSAHTITAKFQVNTYTISASSGANGQISPNGATTLSHGGSQTFSISPDKGYHIGDVKVDGVSIGAVTTYTFTNVIAVHTIAASFTINQHTVTASAGANGAISPSGSTTVVHGASQTFSLFPNIGYKVAAITVNGTSVTTASSYTITDITGDTTIYASFAINSADNTGTNTGTTLGTNNGGNTLSGDTATAGNYTIKVTQTAHGIIAPSTVTVSAGASRSFSITADNGYRVADVIVDGISKGAVNSWTFSNIRASHTITANFGPNICIITVLAGEHGLVTPSGAVEVAYGEDAHFSWKADPGFHIDTVMADGATVDTANDYQFVNVTGDHSLTVAFQADAVITFSLWWVLLIILLFAIVTLILMFAKRRKKDEKEEPKPMPSETIGTIDDIYPKF